MSVADPRWRRLARKRDAELVASNAVRWAGNILAEVLTNHGRFLTDAERAGLKKALDGLAEFNFPAATGDDSGGTK